MGLGNSNVKELNDAKKCAAADQSNGSGHRGQRVQAETAGCDAARKQLTRGTSGATTTPTSSNTQAARDACGVGLAGFRVSGHEG